MKTLTINFKFRDPELTLSGLSFKRLEWTDAEKSIYRGDTGRYAIDTRHRINDRTAKIELDFLVEILKDIDEAIGFDRIKYIGYYDTQPDILLQIIKKES